MRLEWEGITRVNDVTPFSPQGWLLVLGLVLQSSVLVLVQPQLFWTGMRLALHARSQCILAVHAKMLRLSSSAVADFSTGKVRAKPEADVGLSRDRRGGSTGRAQREREQRRGRGPSR